jgi:hypothetical protein
MPYGQQGHGHFLSNFICLGGWGWNSPQNGQGSPERRQPAGQSVLPLAPIWLMGSHPSGFAIANAGTCQARRIFSYGERGPGGGPMHLTHAIRSTNGAAGGRFTT